MKSCVQEPLKREESNNLTGFTMFYRSDKLNIVVEDSAKEFIYEILFEKLFDQDIKLLCSGCKNTSIKLHSKLHEEDKNKVVFLLDGDFDILFHSKECNVLNNLVYLDKYDIESYFINDISLFAAARLSFKCTKENLQEYFNFNDWCIEISQSLSNLFVLFAIAHSNGICMKKYTGNKSVGEAFNYFIDDNGNVNIERLSKLDIYLTSKLHNLPDLKEEVFLSIKQNCQSSYDFICGKYYIKSFKNSISSKLKPHLGRVSIKDDFFNGSVYTNPVLDNFMPLKKKISNCINWS